MMGGIVVTCRITRWRGGNMLVLDRLHRPLLSWGARHADERGSRIQRQHGAQQPDKKCLEETVHKFTKYISALSA